MRKYLALLTLMVLVGALVIGCGGPAMVHGGDTVRIDYTLKLEDGTVYDTSTGGDPLEFTLGQGNFPATIEEAFVGMKVGDSKVLDLRAAQAFGQRNEELVIEVSKDELPDGLEPEIGMQLQSNAGDGTTITLAVIGVSETTVTLDGNHPLAGHDVTFELELVEILTSDGASLTSSEAPEAFTEAMANGLPTIAEFGSSSCIPCKQMKPILEELTVEYEGKANVVIVEVYDYIDLARQYKIMGIPTQIFYDASGKEVTRHTGFSPKEDIIEEFNEMGVE